MPTVSSASPFVAPAGRVHRSRDSQCPCLNYSQHLTKALWPSKTNLVRHLLASPSHEILLLHVPRTEPSPSPDCTQPELPATGRMSRQATADDARCLARRCVSTVASLRAALDSQLDDDDVHLSTATWSVNRCDDV